MINLTSSHLLFSLSRSCCCCRCRCRCCCCFRHCQAFSCTAGSPSSSFATSATQIRKISASAARCPSTTAAVTSASSPFRHPWPRRCRKVWIMASRYDVTRIWMFWQLSLRTWLPRPALFIVFFLVYFLLTWQFFFSFFPVMRPLSYPSRLLIDPSPPINVQCYSPYTLAVLATHPLGK